MLEVNVAGVVAGCVDVGHVGGNELFATGSQLEIALHNRKYGYRRHAYLLGGSPYSLILLRMVRTLMPNISAAWVRLPRARASVFSRCIFSSTHMGVPGNGIAGKSVRVFPNG